MPHWLCAMCMRFVSMFLVILDVLVRVCICVFVCVINQGRKSKPRWSFASHYDREEEEEEGLDAAAQDPTNWAPAQIRQRHFVADLYNFCFRTFLVRTVDTFLYFFVF